MRQKKITTTPGLKFHYDHLVMRMHLYAHEGNRKYVNALEEFAMIPGFTKTDAYKSYFDLCTAFHECQTREAVISEMLDEFLDIMFPQLTEKQQDRIYNQKQSK